MEKWPVLRIVRAVSIAVVLAAIVAQAKTLADAGLFDPTRFFAFFTIQSNLIGVAAFSWLVARPGADRGRGIELLRAGAAVYLTLKGERPEREFEIGGKQDEQRGEG